MEFRNLRSFLRVAELGSFTRAAADLGYAQSTVTAQIQQMEAEIGVLLFERIGKKTVLTENGQRMKRYAEQTLKMEEAMKSIGRPEGGTVTGTLRVGVVESIMNSLMLNVIGDLRVLFPKVAVQIRLAVTTPLIEMLRRNEIDIAFTIGEMTHIRDCLRAYSHPETAVFIAGADHPLAKKTAVSLEDIFNESIIVTGDVTYLQQELSKLAHRSNRDIDSNIQAESSNVVLNLVERNLGICYLPRYLAESAMAARRIAILPVTGYRLQFYTHIVYHKNKWVTPQMDGLMRLTKQFWENRDA